MIMELAVKKEELIKWIQNSKDEDVINKIIALKSDIDKQVVIHTINGCPIGREEYGILLNEADNRISSGEYTTVENLEKEIEDW